MAGSTSSLVICAIGIYATFLTWALVQEPLATRTWPNSMGKFQFPNVIALIQASVAMMMGYLYLNWKKVEYPPRKMIKDHWKQLMLISFTQSSSGPLATTSLKHVDYYKITSAMITQFLLGKVSKIVENFPPSIPTTSLVMVRPRPLF